MTNNIDNKRETALYDIMLSWTTNTYYNSYSILVLQSLFTQHTKHYCSN